MMAELFENRILYQMCRETPLHNNPTEVAGKILLIGRTYAAAMERGAGFNGSTGSVYKFVIAPAIVNSDIDAWIEEAKAANIATAEGFSTVVRVHGNVNALFSSITETGISRRSLTSKYLHFHAPDKFFIYDSIACRSIKDALGKVLVKGHVEGADKQYYDFYAKCLMLRLKVFDEEGVILTPRQLDQRLLNY